MPLSPNFQFAAPSKEQVAAPDYATSLAKGMEVGFMPAFKTSDLLTKMLQAKMTEPYATNADQWFQADLDYRKALANQANRGSSGGSFSSMLSGPAKEAYAVDQLKENYGEDSPIYQMAKRAYDAKLGALEGLTDYRQGLTRTQGTRGLSAIGKLTQEEEDVRAGFEPGTNRQHQIAPDRQEELLGQYALSRQKAASDADTRKKNLLASNIEKTVDSISVDDLVPYAGLKGALKLKSEETKASVSPGSESEQYRKYAENVNKSKLLAKQVRQFYGDSIQPSMLNKLEQMTNPATWRNNPEIAKRNFDSFKNLLQQEMGTYRGALKNTKEFEGAQHGDDPLGLR